MLITPATSVPRSGLQHRLDTAMAVKCTAPRTGCRHTGKYTDFWQ